MGMYIPDNINIKSANNIYTFTVSRKILRLKIFSYNYKYKVFIESETPKSKLTKYALKSISLKNLEPLWVSLFRLNALKYFLFMRSPTWLEYILKNKNKLNLLFYNAIVRVDAKVLKPNSNRTSADESKKIAIDLVLDSVSVNTTYRDELAKHGIIFCNISNALRNYPDLTSIYLGSAISSRDNYYASLNSVVFSEGSFVYVPKNTFCPIDLSTYFRINSGIIGQFERTLIVSEFNSSVSYMEGCTAPSSSISQLHAASVELICFKKSLIKYSTIQNWYPGDTKGKGGIYNFVTKRGLALGDDSRISWTQVETGSSLTWKYPSVILKGIRSQGAFYSIAVTRLCQKADTGTKMIHIGDCTRSKIISKGISLNSSSNYYRGLVEILNTSNKSINTTQCDSIIFGRQSNATTYPYIRIANSSGLIEHEASVAKIKDDQLFYLQQRGLNLEDAITLIVNGFCKEVIEELPLEFLEEFNELLNSSLASKIG